MYVEGSVGFSLGWEIGFGLVYRSTLIGVGMLADRGTFRRFHTCDPMVMHRASFAVVIARVTSHIFWGDLWSSHWVTHTQEEKRKKK